MQKRSIYALTYFPTNRSAFQHHLDPFDMATLLRATTRSVGFLIKGPFLSARSYSGMSGLLIEEQKYSWLKQLDLQAENPGVFNGKWCGSGEVSF